MRLVALDVGHADGGEIFERRAQTHRVGDIAGSSFGNGWAGAGTAISRKSHPRSCCRRLATAAYPRAPIVGRRELRCLWDRTPCVPIRTKKSAPSAFRSIGICEADCAPSISTVAPARWARSITSFTRRHRAERVGDVCDGNDLGALRQQPLKFIQPQLTRRIDGSDLQLRAALEGKHLPGYDVGMVLEMRHQDFVPGGDVLAAPTLSHQIDCLSGSAHEHDLVGRGGAEGTAALGGAPFRTRPLHARRARERHGECSNSRFDRSRTSDR